jgi:hypothetical protein
MDEPTSSAAETRERGRFSLLQLVAVLTAAGSAFALYYVVLSPPIGSSGLVPALIPGGLLLVAIWFCRSTPIKRLGTYAVVAALLSVAFFQAYIARTDWLFGHTLGPPQLVIATFATALVGLLAGLVWGASKLASRSSGPAANMDRRDRAQGVPSWLGAVGVVLCTLFSALMVLNGAVSVPKANARLAEYVKQRQLRAEEREQSMERYQAALKETHLEVPGIIAKKVAALKSEDVATRRQEASNIRAIICKVRGPSPLAQIFNNPATKAALMSALDDNDPEVRRQVAMAIVELRDQTERSERLKAIAALGIRQDSATVTDGMVTLLRMLDWETDEECRCAAIRAVGRMGAAASAAAPQFGVIVQKGAPAERAAAAEALAAMGPTAGQFLPNHRAPAP